MIIQIILLSFGNIQSYEKRRGKESRLRAHFSDFGGGPEVYFRAKLPPRFNWLEFFARASRSSAMEPELSLAARL